MNTRRAHLVSEIQTRENLHESVADAIRVGDIAISGDAIAKAVRPLNPPMSDRVRKALAEGQAQRDAAKAVRA